MTYCSWNGPRHEHLLHISIQAASPSLLSDMEELSVPLQPTSSTGATTSNLEEEDEEEVSRSSSPDSMVLAIDEAINILDPPRARVRLSEKHRKNCES